MRVCLLVDPARAQRWHLWLKEDLEQALGSAVVVRESVEHHALPMSVRLLTSCDKLVHSSKAPTGVDDLEQDALQALLTGSNAGAEPFDLLVNCSGHANPWPTQRELKPVFCGTTDELALLDALVRGQPVEISVWDSWGATALVHGRPAIEYPRKLTAAADSVTSSMIALLVQAARQHSKGQAQTTSPSDESIDVSPVNPTSLGLSGFEQLGRALAGKVGRKLGVLKAPAERWGIAYRSTATGSFLETAGASVATFTLIPDDGKRFYADPCVFTHQGRTYIFCEELPFATSRGIVCICEVLADGSVTPFTPVLERPYHLSYPYVFEENGEIWMLPETGANGTVELYRAVDFPHSWALHRVLIDKLKGFDATPLWHQGRLYLFVSGAHRSSTSWDTLRILHAPSLDGPFVEHDMGLVMMDARFARSAGAILRWGDTLIRPTQDCSVFYGGAMVLARIDTLNPRDYRQTAVSRITATGPSSSLGTHTYSRAGTIEAVDVYGAIDGVARVTLYNEPLRSD